jgi:hypothetical protein
MSFKKILPQIGCHVAQGRPHIPPMKSAINMVDHHPSPQSWMECDHKSLQRRGGQLPQVRLMEASMINDRRRMLSMASIIAVMSAPRLTIQLSHGFQHFASTLYHLALPENLVLAQSILLVLVQLVLRPLGSAMPRERGKPRQGPAWYNHAAR